MKFLCLISFILSIICVFAPIKSQELLFEESFKTSTDANAYSELAKDENLIITEFSTTVKSYVEILNIWTTDTQTITAKDTSISDITNNSFDSSVNTENDQNIRYSASTETSEYDTSGHPVADIDTETIHDVIWFNNSSKDQSLNTSNANILDRSDKKTTNISRNEDDEEEIYNKVKIYSCRCYENEVWINETCLFNKTFINVFNISSSQVEAIPVSDFFYVDVGNNVCDDHQYQKVINAESSLLFQNGHLYDSINTKVYTQDEYCLEYTYDNNIVDYDFKACRNVPEVSQCCPSGSVKHINGDCKLEENFIFSPVFSDGTILTNVSGEVKEFLNCEPGFKIKIDNLSNPDSNYKLVISNFDESNLKKYASGFDIGHTLYDTDFCIAAIKNHDSYYYGAYYCEEVNQQQICTGHPCYQKCCPEGYNYDESYHKCVKDSLNLTFPFIEEGNDSRTNHDEELRSIIHGRPFCEDFVPIEILDKELPPYFKEEELHIPSISHTLKLHEYCVENVGQGTEFRSVVFACFGQGQLDSICSWKFLFVSILLGISTFFLLTTLIVYLALTHLRSRISGKCLISEVIALIISYVTLIIIQNAQNQLSSYGCRLAGLIEYMSILASFFWLTILCTDMWLTIRSQHPVDRGFQSRKKFVLYSLFGWGVPALIGVVIIVIDNLPDDEAYSHILRSGIGEKSCFFADTFTQWVYLYSIIVVLLSINILLFCFVVRILVKAHKNNKKMFKNGNRTAGTADSPRERFFMYLKLCIVMGVTWIAEVISSEMSNYNYSCLYWLPTDIINALRGLTIFIIFVCKKKTLNKIRSRFNGPNMSLKSKTSSRRISRSSERKTRSSNISGLMYQPTPDKVEFRDQKPIEMTDF